MLRQIPSDAVRVMPDPLREMAAEIFRRLELSDSDAEFIAGRLVQVDLRGVFSHGTRQLRHYARLYRTGDLNPRPNIRVLRETPVSAYLDGDGGLGYFVATRATEMAIEKAGASGIAIAGTRNNGHAGSMGIYARMALQHDLVTLCVAGGSGWQPPVEPDATVWDAVKAPPMCFGIPSADGPPLVFDVSTNVLRGKNRLQEAMDFLPEAVVRSFGLKFVSTLLGGILAGAVPPEERRGDFSAANRGFLIVAFDPGVFGDAEGFKREVERIIAASRRLKPLPGFETAEVPGSPEWQRERDWAREGIPLSAEHRGHLEAAAGDLGVKVPW